MAGISLLLLVLLCGGADGRARRKGASGKAAAPPAELAAEEHAAEAARAAMRVLPLTTEPFDYCSDCPADGQCEGKFCLRVWGAFHLSFAIRAALGAAGCARKHAVAAVQWRLPQFTKTAELSVLPTLISAEEVRCRTSAPRCPPRCHLMFDRMWRTVLRLRS